MALFIDEAHELHNNTLVGLKRLMEVVSDAGGSLSIVLSGHPKLKNDLQRPTMEEIGYRTTIITFEGIAGQQRPQGKRTRSGTQARWPDRLRARPFPTEEGRARSADQGTGLDRGPSV